MRTLLVAMFLGVAFGCAPTVAPAYLDALAAGDRALSAGRQREALEAYDRAARDATRPRDRAEAEYRAGRTLVRLGERAEALTRFDRVAASSPGFERGARAAYEAAVIRCDDATTHERGMDALDALVRTQPMTGPARLALQVLLREDDAHDPSGVAALARLDALRPVPSVQTSMLYESVLAERARRLEAMGRTRDAEVAWQALFNAVPYPQNSRWDDGHMALAALLRRQGDARGAVAILDAMLAPRDPDCIGGTCDAPLFQEGAMLRGEILRDDLADPASAARAFRAAYEMFPTSRMRDNALEAEAEARERVGDGSACRVWAELAERFPCTRRGRAARRRARACGRTVSPEVNRCE